MTEILVETPLAKPNDGRKNEPITISEDRQQNAAAFLVSGRTHAHRGNYSEALADLQHVTHLEPANHEAFYYLGLVYFRLGEYKSAMQNLKSAIEKASTVSTLNVNRYYCQYAYVCQMDGQFKEAITYYSKFIKKVSGEEQCAGLLNRGLCYEHMNQYEKALSDFDRVVSLNSSNQKSYSYFCRGRVKAQLGDRTSAEEDFNLAVSHSSSSLRFVQGLTNNELHQHEQSIENYTHAIQNNQHVADSYFRRGVSYAVLGKHSEAIEDYTSAIRVDKKHHRAYFRRGLSNVELGRLEDALRDYTTAINLAKYNKDVYLMRAQLYLQLKRVDEARKDFKEAAFWEQNGIDDEEDAITPTPDDKEMYIDPKSPCGILLSGIEKQNTGDNVGAMLSFNQLLDVDLDTLRKELAQLNAKDSRRFHYSVGKTVLTTVEKHQIAMKNFAHNPNLTMFYASVLIQLEEFFIGCKAAASGKVKAVEGRLGQVAEVMNLVGQVISVIPVVPAPSINYK
ncbi:unnamed protein product, partial [Didymodactylos carnosus]